MPEQQTRINDKISAALETNPNIRLGFDACCNCAKPLKGSDKEDVCCKGCRQVWYCSKECRREDGENHDSNNEEEQGRGHSAIICALCKLCNIDEEVENEVRKLGKLILSSDKTSAKTSSKKSRKNFSDEEKRAAYDRISTEYESYPATLTNVMMDAPCFEPTLEKFMVKRRCKKTRQSDIEEDEQLNNNTLTIHIIGASKESELWGDFKLDTSDATNAYTEALSELAATYKGLRKINLIFIGPNCPTDNLHVVKTMDDIDIDEETSTQESGKKRKRNDHHGKRCQVVIETHCHNYEWKYLNSKESHSKKKGKHSSLLSKPDIVTFFNPGFTCPDYDWSEALKACQDRDARMKTPFFVTTNTEMEAIADVQYLHQHGYIDSLPSMVADIVNEGKLDHDSDTFDHSENSAIFFGENINAGNRVRQSGNMANDLFCKNKYIFGGHFSHGESRRKTNDDKKIEEKKGKSSAKSSKSVENKKADSSKSSNSKRKNAALM